MFSLEYNLAILIFSVFMLLDYHRTRRYLQRYMFPQTPMIHPESPKVVNETRMHIASTLAEMKKSTRKRKKDQPPSAEWYKEMRMTLGFRWTKKRDNMLLLAAAKQDHSVPRFAEVADMLDWYPAQELEDRFSYLIYALTMRAIRKKEAEVGLETALARLREPIGGG